MTEALKGQEFSETRYGQEQKQEVVVAAYQRSRNSEFLKETQAGTATRF